MLITGSLAFLLFGAILVLLGASQDALVASLELSLTDFGLLGAALSAGIGAGVLTAGPLVDRFPRRPIFAASTAISAVALLCFSPGLSFGTAFALVALLGFGTGIYDTLLNAVTVEHYANRAVRMIAFLHASVTIGAIATPIAVSIALEHSDWTSIFRSIGIAYIGLTAMVMLTPLPAPRLRAAQQGAPRPSLSRFLRLDFAALCAVGFLYIGIEAGLTLFSVPYSTGGLGLEAERGRGAISTFWAGILAARILLSVYPREVGALHMSIASLAAAAVLGASITLQLSAVEATTALAGFLLGIVFPVMITQAGRRFPDSPGTATGLVAGLGSFGGFGLPWLIGAVGDVAGESIAFSGVALACALLAGAAYAARPHSAAQPG